MTKSVHKNYFISTTQATLSDFEKWSSTALKTFNNYTIIMTNKSDKIGIS